MADIKDVGQYIIDLVGDADRIKLQKLSFFAHGWHLAWTGLPLTDTKFQAWRHGPVSAELREAGKGTTPSRHANSGENYQVTAVEGGDPTRLTSYEAAVVEAVVEFYAQRSPFELVNASHGKTWQEARRGIPRRAVSQNVLSDTTALEEFTNLSLEGHGPTPPPTDFNDISISDDWRSTLLEIESQTQETLRILANR